VRGEKDTRLVGRFGPRPVVVTPNFKIKSNVHSMCD
jgi:hypothetical protein